VYLLLFVKEKTEQKNRIYWKFPAHIVS